MAALLGIGALGLLTAAEPQRDAEDALRRARCDGKYEMLLRQIKVPQDGEKRSTFIDEGFRDDTEYEGHTDLPPGYWVYVAPCWYIFRDLAATPKPRRNWGPEQMIGPPDAWPNSGDIVQAWASLSEDAQDEWVLLEYPEPVLPRAVLVYETFNPGAVNRITAFNLEGEEVELWKGKDPTPVGSQKGLSVIPVKANFKTNRLKLYINSKDVPGWNEIDAVGMRDNRGRIHWVSAADASTTYAEPMPMPRRMDDTDRRLNKLERDVRSIKESVMRIEKLLEKKKPK
jgi:hypothetical protein